MAAAPDHSLPDQHRNWADLKAAYRFLNNPEVTPAEIQRSHREQLRADCATQARILSIQDGSELDFTHHPSVQDLGFVGGGTGQGLLQHSSLAVTTEGQVLGVLHQVWWKRVETPPGETRRQRRERPTESSLWADSIRAVGVLNLTPRVIHVMDRGGDCFESMQAAFQTGSGFLIRARHDRFVHEGREKLWPFMQRQSIAGTRDVCVPRRPAKGKRPAQPARIARLAVRYAPVLIPCPHNDPRFKEPLRVWAVYIKETDPPAGIDPIEWMLLTNEAVDDLAAANERVDWYTYRWIIEEWHKIEKTGCRLESSQLKTAAALERLAAFTAVVAVRILQLRNLAQAATEPEAIDSASPSEQPAALQAVVPPNWIDMVSYLAKRPPKTLTPRQFWWTIAKRGGFIGRKSDGQPGWQTIWKGWMEVMKLIQGLEIHQAMLREQSCG